MSDSKTTIPPKPKKKRTFLKVFLALMVLGAGSLAAWFFLFPVDERDIYHFVPENAIYIIESEAPIDNWKELSDSEIWKHMKTHAYFADINESADYLDSLVHKNEALLNLVGKQQLLISGHKDQPDDYDFLFLVNLHQGAKVADLLVNILKKANIGMNDITLAHHDMIEIPDPDYGSLYIGFVDNIFVGSYSKKILENSLKQYSNPYFTQSGYHPEDPTLQEHTHPRFTELDKKVRKMRSGPYQVFLNYAALSGFLRIYMDEIPEMAKEVLEVMEFSGFDFEIADESADLEGLTQTNDSVSHLLNAIKSVKGSKINAANILPENTSFFMSINFDKFDHFHDAIDTQFREDQEGYADYQKQVSRVKKFTKIDIDEHFLSWIGEEITFALIPRQGLYNQASYVGAFHTRDMEYARTKLAYVDKRIKKLPGFKFHSSEYRHYEVKYLEMSAFFRLFFGKLNKKFDKPNYIYLDEYVVFSNDTTTLHRMIDHYEGKTTLNKKTEYYKFFNHFERKSNYFIYMNTDLLYPVMKDFADPETQKDLRDNEAYIKCFRQIGVQLNSEGDRYDSHIHLDFQKPTQEGS